MNVTISNIRLDVSDESIVVTCQRCPWWSSFAWTRLAAWESAAGHELRVHPGDTTARNALDQIRHRTRRAASKSS